MEDQVSATEATARQPRLAYLFSRYPVVSQTFCDSEMMALEDRGFEIEIGSINPPLNAFRHERFDELNAEAVYPPPPRMLEGWKRWAEATGQWREKLGEMIARHDQDYGASFKAATRARNAVYFAEQLKARGVEHVHVHFANRATHTALFMKAWSGMPFSFTAHAQDFMVDLGSDDLLRELCREAEFVVTVSDFSEKLLRETCPESAEKINRVYNGIQPDTFPSAAIPEGGPLRIVTIGRLIEFKGFHHLIAACAKLKAAGTDFELCLIGEGPWKERLEAQVSSLGLEKEVEFAGVQTREAVKARLAASDVFALGCIVDSKGASDILPTVIMEAMACRLPVVSTQLVGVPEMVDHEKTGLLVEPGDEEALAGALDRLATDRALARQLGEAGYQKCLKLFDQRVTSAELASRFVACASARASEPAERRSGKLLYLVDAWPCVDDAWLEEELNWVNETRGGEISLLAASSPADFRWSEKTIQRWAALLPAFEFLPDGMVLEAEWRHHEAEASRVLELRHELGSDISTEESLVQARRALVLARMVRRRGFTHLHAARSNAALLAWLVNRLTGVAYSATVEADPVLGRDSIGAVLASASLSSRADVRIEGDDPSAFLERDLLNLAPPEAPGHLRIGPIKMRRTATEPEGDRSLIYERWMERLREIAKLPA